jgi:hypothetical protein
MNERIDELAFQSGITQHSYSNPKHPDLDGFIVSQEKLEKFAELLIEECANIDFRKKAFLSQYDDVSVAKTILEHFGVKE